MTTIEIVHVKHSPQGRESRSPETSAFGSRGFSLIELLAVISIMSVLLSMSVVAFQSIAGAQKFTSSAYELASYLEFVRAEAISRQTYVWVGVSTDTTQGRNDVVVAAVYSKDGTGSNVGAPNLAPLARVFRFPNAKLAARDELLPVLQTKFDRSSQSVATNANGIAFQVGALDFPTGKSLTFSPGGEALLKGNAGPNDGYTPLIDLCFLQMKGQQVSAKSDQVALAVDGGSGSVRIVRVE